MTLTITARGSADRSFAPEIATVSLWVSASGPDRDSVASTVTATHRKLSADIAELAARGSVGVWSSGHVSTYSFRGREKGREHVTQTASASVTAEFVDLGEISPAVDRWLREPSISMRGITWDLTRAHRREREAEVRRIAVEDAVAKAKAYADALGASKVDALEIADAGMLVPPGSERFSPGPVALSTFGAASNDAIELRPLDIEINVGVEARFSAS